MASRLRVVARRALHFIRWWRATRPIVPCQICGAYPAEHRLNAADVAVVDQLRADIAATEAMNVSLTDELERLRRLLS